jgi:hypothetical protein
MRIDLDDRDDFNELQAWIDGFDPQPWSDSDLPSSEPSPDVATQVNLAAGEFFRATWRRRLADANGNCGYVARQMRKAGVPLDLALAILLTPDVLPAADQTSSRPTAFADTDWPPAGAGQLGVARTVRYALAHAA